MILRSTNAADAEVESACVAFIRDRLGAADAEVLLAWIWDNAVASRGPVYVEALRQVSAVVRERGPDAVGRLLALARKPKEQRDAEFQLAAWFLPRGERAAATIAGHRLDPKVIAEQRAELAEALLAELHRMWPDRHQATARGAVMEGLQVDARGVQLRAEQVVRAMRAPDPLQQTAAASWLA